MATSAKWTAGVVIVLAIWGALDIIFAVRDAIIGR